MTISKEIMKKIEKAVDKYVKTFDVKDEGGKITGTDLRHEPETLQEFFVSGIMLGLNKEERQYAKHYFKSKLPYQDWIKTIRSVPNALAESILHFKKLQEEDR